MQLKIIHRYYIINIYIYRYYIRYFIFEKNVNGKKLCWTNSGNSTNAHHKNFDVLILCNFRKL